MLAAHSTQSIIQPVAPSVPSRAIRIDQRAGPRQAKMLQHDKEMEIRGKEQHTQLQSTRRHARSGHVPLPKLCLLAAMLVGTQGVHGQGTGSYVPITQGTAGSKKVAIIVGVCVVAGFVLLIGA